MGILFIILNRNHRVIVIFFKLSDGWQCDNFRSLLNISWSTKDAWIEPRTVAKHFKRSNHSTTRRDLIHKLSWSFFVSPVKFSCTNDVKAEMFPLRLSQRGIHFLSTESTFIEWYCLLIIALPLSFDSGEGEIFQRWLNYTLKWSLRWQGIISAYNKSTRKFKTSISSKFLYMCIPGYWDQNNLVYAQQKKIMFVTK